MEHPRALDRTLPCVWKLKLDPGNLDLRTTLSRKLREQTHVLRTSSTAPGPLLRHIFHKRLRTMSSLGPRGV